MSKDTHCTSRSKEKASAPFQYRPIGRTHKSDLLQAVSPNTLNIDCRHNKQRWLELASEEEATTPLSSKRSSPNKLSASWSRPAMGQCHRRHAPATSESANPRCAPGKCVHCRRHSRRSSPRSPPGEEGPTSRNKFADFGLLARVWAPSWAGTRRLWRLARSRKHTTAA